jgi:xanthine/uracil/vitamin C permease (AzgA family)
MAEMTSDELTRRHRAAATLVSALITLTLVLVALAYAGVRTSLPSGLLNPTLYGALWIVIAGLGLGAIALRRMRFGALRLQTIAEAKGASALLATLHKTTVLVALFGIAIALVGYVLFMRSADAWDMLKAGIIAIAILLYTYPRRAAWQKVLQATQTTEGLTTDGTPAKGTPA